MIQFFICYSSHWSFSLVNNNLVCSLNPNHFTLYSCITGKLYITSFQVNLWEAGLGLVCSSLVLELKSEGCRTEGCSLSGMSLGSLNFKLILLSRLNYLHYDLFKNSSSYVLNISHWVGRTSFVALFSALELQVFMLFRISFLHICLNVPCICPGCIMRRCWMDILVWVNF